MYSQGWRAGRLGGVKPRCNLQASELFWLSDQGEGAGRLSYFTDCPWYFLFPLPPPPVSIRASLTRIDPFFKRQLVCLLAKFFEVATSIFLWKVVGIPIYIDIYSYILENYSNKCICIRKPTDLLY